MPRPSSNRRNYSYKKKKYDRSKSSFSSERSNENRRHKERYKRMSSDSSSLSRVRDRRRSSRDILFYKKSRSKYRSSVSKTPTRTHHQNRKEHGSKNYNHDYRHENDIKHTENSEDGEIESRSITYSKHSTKSKRDCYKYRPRSPVYNSYHAKRPKSKSPFISRKQRSSPVYNNNRSRNRHQSQDKLSVSSTDTSDDESLKGEPQQEEYHTEDEMLKKLFGLTQFDTSKGKPHYDAELFGLNKRSKRRYRQYMNRRGGFNRPLSPVF